ncbi:hypothetical protein R5R35_006217 [Gryllus longicercus]|uniref:Odorant receptor n=1 Tax=Gryllus longicercus TaxID=2509291 RepID=A0AAN9ZGD3_9ORTH
MWREKEWKRLIRIVENNFNRPANRIKKEDRLIMEESVRLNRYVGLVWTLLVSSMLASFTVRPVIESFLLTPSLARDVDFNTTTKPQRLPSMWDIPYRTWTPFDNMSIIPYGFVYFLHVFVASLQIFLVPTYDMFFIALVNYTCGQFRILQRELRIIREDSK